MTPELLAGFYFIGLVPWLLFNGIIEWRWRRSCWRLIEVKYIDSTVAERLSEYREQVRAFGRLSISQWLFGLFVWPVMAPMCLIAWIAEPKRISRRG